MRTSVLRFRPDEPAGGVVAPVVADVPINNGEGDPVVERVVPQEPGTPSSIGDASRLYREKLEKIAADADTAAAAKPAPVVEPEKQPRAADGTFAAKEPADGIAIVAPGDASVVEGNVVEDPPVAEEPKLFVLKGEASRGETDIELDATDLPPEVVERLSRLEKQGMRRTEYDGAMQKVRMERADLDAVETEMRVDPEGFVLNRIAPSTRQQVAEVLLLDQWDNLAPLIHALWEDEKGRGAKIDGIKKAISQRQGDVMATVTASRQAAEVRAAVSQLVPENAPEDEAGEFFQSAIALLQRRVLNNESVTPKDVPALLAAHRRRFFGAVDAASAVPAARPKLAVRQPPSVVAPAPGPKKTVAVSQDEVARRARARAGALAAAPQGAGAGAVQRVGGPANETIQEASKRLRAQKTG